MESILHAFTTYSMPALRALGGRSSNDPKSACAEMNWFTCSWTTRLNRSLSSIQDRSCELSSVGPHNAVKHGVQLMILFPGLSSNVTATSPKSEPATDSKVISLSDITS